MQLMSIWRSTFTPLRLPDLRVYLSGQGLSLTGTWLQTTAQSLLVYQLSGGSATALGVVAVAGALPVLIFSFWIGGLADRFDRRKFLIATQIGEMLLAFILALLVQTDLVQLWHVYLLAFLLGCCEAGNFPAQQAFLADVVGPQEVRTAMGLYSMIFNISRVIGPALAGYIVGAFGLAISFWLNGLSFLAVIASLMVLRSVLSTHRPTVTVVPEEDETLDALAYVRHHLSVRDLLLTVAFINAFGTSIYTIAPSLVEGNAGDTGLLLGAAGAGALFSVFFILPVVNHRVKRIGVALSLSLVWMGFWLFMLSRSQSVAFSVFALFFAGMATTIVYVTNMGLLQVLPPPMLRGRILGLFNIVGVGVQPMAALVIGALADRFSPPTAVLVSSIMLIFCGAVMLVRPWWRAWQVEPVALSAQIPGH